MTFCLLVANSAYFIKIRNKSLGPNVAQVTNTLHFFMFHTTIPFPTFN